MKIFKKNQLAILVISLMLITAGYLNYDSSISSKAQETSVNPEESVDLASIGDAELVNTNPTEENKTDEVKEEKKEVTEQTTNTEIKEETTEDGKNYFVTSKLERNVMYSQMIERYQGVVNNSSAAQEQKSIAGQEINKINELQNAIMISENLLSSKGFNENIIFVNGDSISVIIGKKELTPEEIAQIQNIVSRELKAEIDNIHISVK